MNEVRGRAIGSLLLAFQLFACGGRTTLEVGAGTSRDASASDSGTVTFPTGKYTHCAVGVYEGMSATGFAIGASLTLAQSGDRVAATYVDSTGNTNSFDFLVKASGSAALIAPAQLDTRDVWGGNCGLGIYPMGMNASAGALTYDAGTAFVSLEGKFEGDAGACGRQVFPASYWLTCDGGPASEPVAGAPPSARSLPTGEFTCNSQIATSYNDGTQGDGSFGENGILTLSRTGADVLAKYSGDQVVTGAMRLNAATSITAIADKGQTLTAACDVVATGGDVSQTPGALPIAAGALSIDDGTLFLSFAGVMGENSPCAGAAKAGSLICTKN